MKNKFFSSKTCNATITIEASYIFPFIIFVTLFFLLYSFYCHDRVISKASAYTTLCDSFLNGNNSDELSDSLQKMLDSNQLLKISHFFGLNDDKNSFTLIYKNTNPTTVRFTGTSRTDDIRKCYSLLKVLNQAE